MFLIPACQARDDGVAQRVVGRRRRPTCWALRQLDRYGSKLKNLVEPEIGMFILSMEMYGASN